MDKSNQIEEILTLFCLEFFDNRIMHDTIADSFFPLNFSKPQIQLQKKQKNNLHNLLKRKNSMGKALYFI